MRQIYANNKLFFRKIFILLGIILFLLLLRLAFAYIGPFVIGYIISLILSPVVSFFHKKLGIHRGVTTAILILTCITAIIALGSLIVNVVANEMMLFFQDVPHYLASVEEFFDTQIINLENLMGTELDITFDGFAAQILTIATNIIQGGDRAGLGFFAQIPGAIFRTAITVVSAFFFIRDKELVRSSIIKLMPKAISAEGVMIKGGILKALAGYAKGQLIIMSIVVTICTIGLLIIGSNYALFISLGIGLFDLVPILGAGWILIPWSVYMFLTGNISFGVGLLIIYAAIFLSRQIMEPRVVAKQMGIHPLILLISIYLGLTIIGPTGVLAGPMISIAIKTVFEAEI